MSGIGIIIISIFSAAAIIIIGIVSFKYINGTTDPETGKETNFIVK